MAGDWIKVRTSLFQSPKVSSMARFLGRHEPAAAALCPGYSGTAESVLSRQALRYVTVASLVTVWGAAREHAPDGVFQHADLYDLDDIAGIPGFGEAMASVGWAVEDSQDAVILPNFQEWNVSGQDSAAERQRRYRERKKRERDVTGYVTRDVTGDATVTPQRREEKSITTPPVSPSSRSTSNSAKRGQRLPDDFTLTDERLTIATDLGLSQNQARFEFDKFTDHWKASSGQNARKRDWDATWRNWCRRAVEQRQHRHGGNGLDEVAWANLMQHVRDGHSLEQVTQSDAALARAAEWLGGMARLRRMSEYEINRERGKFTSLYQQAQQETGNV